MSPIRSGRLAAQRYSAGNAVVAASRVLLPNFRAHQPLKMLILTQDLSVILRGSGVRDVA
jgi:hypothetical protein